MAAFTLSARRFTLQEPQVEAATSSWSNLVTRSTSSASTRTIFHTDCSCCCPLQYPSLESAGLSLLAAAF